MKMSWFYNKKINGGDTSDIIANVENVFVCWKTPSKISYKNLRSFQGEYPWRSSVPVKLLPFANHRNFTYDSVNYELQNFIIILWTMTWDSGFLLS